MKVETVGKDVTTDYSTKFWDRIAERYANNPVADEAGYQKELAVTQEYFRPDMKVLEFGCGTGSTAIVHAPYVSHYQAIDVSQKMIEIARRKQSQTNIKNLSFSTAALEEFQVANEFLDAVLGLNVIHLLNDRDDVIRRVYTMLKPGGIFVSRTACVGDTMPFLRFIVPIGKCLGLMPRVKVFTRQELENSLEQAGFSIGYHFIPANSKDACFLIALKPK